jgi:hypothetical protein
MTEQEWITCTDPEAMLTILPGGRANDRKKRLFAFACCRTVWALIPEKEHREAILVAERHVDGQATDAELGAVVASVHRGRRKGNMIDWAVYYTVRYPRGGDYKYAWFVVDDIARAVASAAAPNPSPTAIGYFRGDKFIIEDVPPNRDRLRWNASYAAHRSVMADLLRDIYGPIPLRPAVVDPRWLTPAVISLAEAIYDGRAFDRLSILADALENAGCDRPDILAHCRSTGPHTRGCWPVDLALRKS